MILSLIIREIVLRISREQPVAKGKKVIINKHKLSHQSQITQKEYFNLLISTKSIKKKKGYSHHEEEIFQCLKAMSKPTTNQLAT